jgi:cytochrome c
LLIQSFCLLGVRLVAVSSVAITVIVFPFAAGAGELHKLARMGDLAAVGALLEKGADVNETDGEGQTALHEAAKAGHAKIVSALLAAGANPLIRGMSPFGSTGTALHVAAKLGQVESVRVLLEAGLDPNLNDAGAGPPLHLAIRFRRNAVAELLKSYGAKPIAAVPVGNLIATASPEAGRLIANSCAACHHLEKSQAGNRRQGPPLWGIVGRPKAAVTDYVYSDAMKTAGGIWSYDDLNSFLTDPRAYLPGTKMEGLQGVATPERRADLIRYLRDLSDAPLELPR